MPYLHFTADDRDKLQGLINAQYNLNEISKRLSKHVSSIRRELIRNKTPDGYTSGKAHTISIQRRLDSKPRPKKDNRTLMEEVRARIEQDHSPEQIAGRLINDYPDMPQQWVSTETIYTWIYERIKAGESLKQHLRQGKKNRRKRITGKEKRVVIKNKVMIDKRPEEVETKNICGHWEGDTVEGAKKLGYIATLVERKTKFLVAFPLVRKESELIASGITRKLKSLDPFLRKTITFDNGTEFAKHQKITKKLGTRIYFAHPYSSWERGLNEHTNGLLRQYFPKEQFLVELSPQQLAKAIHLINNRPRKCLNYRTPAEAFADEICALQI